MLLSHHKPLTGGFTLVETGLALAVVGLILGGVWMGVGAVYNRNRLATGAENINEIAYKIRSAYTGQSGAALGNVQSQVAAGLFPPHMLNAANVPVNPWSGGIVLTMNGGVNFTVQFTNLPDPSICPSLATMFQYTGRNAEPIQVRFTNNATLTGIQTPTTIVAAAGNNCTDITFAFNF